MHLYEQFSVVIFNMQVVIFNLHSVNFIPIICFVKVFCPQAKCHEEAEYHMNTERES